MTKKTRIDKVKDKRLRNIDSVTILSKDCIEIVFHNGETIHIKPEVEDYGYDASLMIHNIRKD